MGGGNLFLGNLCLSSYRTTSTVRRFSGSIVIDNIEIASSGTEHLNIPNLCRLIAEEEDRIVSGTQTTLGRCRVDPRRPTDKRRVFGRQGL
jgi:hypothetical protein